MLYIIMAIILLGLIIMLHEFGHFAFAKSFGVGVIEYAIGMGPVLCWKRYKDTVYSIRLFPIGGYCAMYGENSIETADKGTEEYKSKKRFIKGKQPEFKTDWASNQSYKSKSKWQQLIILLAGPFTNIITGFLVAILSISIFGGAVKPVIKNYTESVNIAKEAGIEIGDEIVAVDDISVLTFQDYKLYTTCYKDKVKNGYDITVKRLNSNGNYELHTYHVVPNESGLIGIQTSNALEQKSISDIFIYAGNQAVYWIKATLGSFHMLASGIVKISDFTGVVGTTSIMGNSLKTADDTVGVIGVFRVLFILFIFVSINLGVMNLLPIPALDGGRALLTFIEGIIKKEIPERIEYALNATGMLFVLFLMAMALINDTIRIITG